MSSYRDRGNPEILHFPGTLAAFATLGLCALVGLVVFLIAVLTGPLWMRLAFGIPMGLVLWCVFRAWPRRITLGVRGAWQYTLFGKKQRMIPYEEMAPPEAGAELAFLSSKPRDGFAATRTIVLASKEQRVRIVHSPRHSDAQRFLDLVRKRVATPPALKS